MMVTFSVLDRKFPFGPKKQNFQFKLKFDAKTDLNMQNHSHAERKQLFQNNYFKKHNLQKTRTGVHVFEMLIEPLSFCVFDYYKKRKENSHSL